MGAYARQCATNLQLWEQRCAELTAKATEMGAASSASPGSSGDRRTVGPSAMLGRPEDYMTAFPLTLPCCLQPQDQPTVVTWNSIIYSPSEGSASSSDVSSDSQLSVVATPDVSTNGATAMPVYSPSSNPSSPAESLQSFDISPRSEVLPSNKLPSIAASGKNPGAGVNSALRAAYEVSVRKKRSYHRNSWNPSVVAVSAAIGAADATTTGYTSEVRLLVPAAAAQAATSDAIFIARPAMLETTCPPSL